MGLDMFMNKKKGVHDHVKVAQFMNARAKFADDALRAICYHEQVDFHDPTEEIVESVMKLLEEMEPALMHQAGLVDFDVDDSNDQNVAYWRKHADLNEYFTQLYYQKTPDEYQVAEFNCATLILTKEDILDLMQKVLREIANPGTEFETGSGFFWGETHREDWFHTLDQLNTIMETTDFEKETIYYSCWY